ncbi:ECF transporter S component [Brevibacillus fulvus]|uniref:Energy-coupling factor transport system substrate-specific component n=1 Tax=Brevibacillus fulvus TaxID=1125967 RepID=A0A939BU23_9BACL|nr:ECF transporter S component [Brevibacillus fulvus]MBM7589066.1 energy-coupling factor transport system substrate-specific component [Brevibacillus fulvus]
MNIGIVLLVALLSLFALILLVAEKARMDEKKLAVVATLGSLAAIVRIPFAVLPSVQPSSFLIMLSGYIFGARAGFLVGAITPLFSNLFLGQGPWTVWQMLAWGLCGASSGLLGKLRKRGAAPLLDRPGRRWLFIVHCTLWGFLYGWIMNLWIYTGMGALANFRTFIGLYVSSLPFDAAHALGNFFFSALFAQNTARILARYHRRLVIARFPAWKGGADGEK